MSDEPEGLRLDIGCGQSRKPGYTGVDCNPEFGHLVADASNLPFEDGTVDAIHSSHLIEHVADTAALLAEWYRVLKPGGTLEIRCPNLLGMVVAWLCMGDPERWDWFFTQHLFGWADVPDEMRHRTGFQASSLVRAVTAAGFVGVECGAVMTRHTSGPQYLPYGDLLCTAVKP